MKTIIAGSRNITDLDSLQQALLRCGFVDDITEVICGGAIGVDTLGANWALNNGVPVIYFKPDWDCHGRLAGFIRNQEMADYADALIAIWDGQSRGTKDMIERATKKGLKIFIFETPRQVPLYGADLD